MDNRLLDYYEEELGYLWESGQEFKKAYPKIAGRIGIEDRECRDPYVERLLESFAFLTARVRLKIDDEFPRFAQRLLETVYPNYLAPMPSMALLQLIPDFKQGNLASGYVVARDTSLVGGESVDTTTPCEYRTAHELTLWPMELVGAEYRATASTAVNGRLSGGGAEIRLSLRTIGDFTFDQLPIQQLPVYLTPEGGIASRLYELLMTKVQAVVLNWQDESAVNNTAQLPGSHVRPLGFGDDEALLPQTQRLFTGYRLLQEYFAFPERYFFFQIANLDNALPRCRVNQIEIILVLNQSDVDFERKVTKASFALFCTPAINLFPRRADPIHLKERTEHPVVGDLTRPIDFEVFSVDEVVGYGMGVEKQQHFTPLYAVNWDRMRLQKGRYFTTHRRARLLSSRLTQRELAHDYLGSELYLSLVDANELPYSSDLRQLSVKTKCTNRDLPLRMISLGDRRFRTISGEPVADARCIVGPTKPRASHIHGEYAWRAISHLSLNYLSLTDTDEQQGATALRELLRLYGDEGDPFLAKQIAAIQSVSTEPVVDRIPTPGPVTFGRGLAVKLTCDESAFAGSGAFLLGAVLEQFFTRYAPINTFTRTTLSALQRKDVINTWPPRIGNRTPL